MTMGPGDRCRTELQQDLNLENAVLSGNAPKRATLKSVNSTVPEQEGKEALTGDSDTPPRIRGSDLLVHVRS